MLQQNFQYHISNDQDQLACLSEIFSLRKTIWPDFLRLPEQMITKIYTTYPNYQIAIIDDTNEKIIAIANTLPIFFQQNIGALPDTGLSWVLQTAFASHALLHNNLLCAISISIHPTYRNQGLSKIIIQKLKQLARAKNLQLIVPLRPNFKSRFPLIAMAQYVNWKNADGLPFDPWLRIHLASGATIVKICSQSIKICAAVSQWEAWTQLLFPGEGDYIINDALVPIKIDKHKMGTYIEPNIWLTYF